MKYIMINKILNALGLNINNECIECIIYNVEVVEKIYEYIKDNKDDMSFQQIHNYIQSRYELDISMDEYNNIVFDSGFTKQYLATKYICNEIYIDKKTLNLCIEIAVQLIGVI